MKVVVPAVMKTTPTMFMQFLIMCLRGMNPDVISFARNFPDYTLVKLK